MAEDVEEGCWVWRYTAEAESLTFGQPYAELPAEVHPVVIGAFRFPKKGGMTLEVRSFERATAAAHFFGPILGARVVLRRARVLNRFFDAADMQGRPRAARPAPRSERHRDRSA